DGKLSLQEIAERLSTFYQSSTVAQRSLGCQVLYDGNPLAGAQVTFVPEKFLGPAVKQASGKTDANGQAAIQIEGGADPGVHLGYYRVEVSRKDAAGKETLPARYNTQTTLGQEVAPDDRSGMITIRLGGS